MRFILRFLKDKMIFFVIYFFIDFFCTLWIQNFGKRIAGDLLSHFFLISRLIRMWKSMLECHHSQYITITLAFHARSSKSSSKSNSSEEVLLQLQHEITSFDSSFSCWFEAFKSYIEALNGWLQNCITQPQEHSRRRAAFSPCRALAPPIFVLSWLVGFGSSFTS